MLRLFLLVLVCLLPVPSLAQSVEVFTDRHHPVFNVVDGVVPVMLDRPEQIEEKLSADLSDNPNIALRQAQEKMLNMQWLHGQNDLGTAYSDVVHAWRLGVIKVPAVVVDGQYVVYGQPDIQKAVAQITRFRQGMRP